VGCIYRQGLETARLEVNGSESSLVYNQTFILDRFGYMTILLMIRGAGIQILGGFVLVWLDKRRLKINFYRFGAMV